MKRGFIGPDLVRPFHFPLVTPSSSHPFSSCTRRSSEMLEGLLFWEPCCLSNCWTHILSALQNNSYWFVMICYINIFISEIRILPFTSQSFPLNRKISYICHLNLSKTKAVSLVLYLFVLWMFTFVRNINSRCVKVQRDVLNSSVCLFSSVHLCIVYFTCIFFIK